MKERRNRVQERKIQRKGSKFWMKDVNFWKSCRWLKKGHQKFLRIEGFFQNFLRMLSENIFSLNFCSTIFVTQIFAPPNIFDKSTPLVMVWSCVAHIGDGHRSWNCLLWWSTSAYCHGDVSSAQLLFSINSASRLTLSHGIVSNWPPITIKCQNKIRALALLAQSLDLNPIENICRKVAEEVVNRHPTMKHELIESIIVAWNRRVTYDYLVKLSTPFDTDSMYL